jgi:predicted ATP-dependent endonuclease of OLD family
MRSANEDKQLQQAADAATKLISTEKATPELLREAHYVKGKSLYGLGDLDGASAEFAQIATNVRTKEGAEAKFMKIQIAYQQKKPEAVEKEVFEFADMNTPFQYWIGKSFLLLGRTYLDKNDAFQAKATIQSILDGYTVKDDGVVDEANKLLKEVEEAEKAKQNVQQAPVEVIQK